MGAELESRLRNPNAASRLKQLCVFSGSESAFWNSCITLFMEIADARFAVLYRSGDADASWRAELALPASLLVDPDTRPLLALGAEVAAEGALNGAARRFLQIDSPGDGGWLIAVGHDESAATVLWLGAVPESQVEEALSRVRLVAYVPSLFQQRQDAARAEIAIGHFASVLDLAALLNSHRRFLATAMTLCNELCTRHHCERVSLGWLKGDYVRLRAVSHSEKFDRRMEAIQMLEAAMEESLDQDEPVVMPADSEQKLVTRDHERFASKNGVKNVCSVPLRLDGDPVAVITLERNETAFSDIELRLLSLCGEVALRRLADLERDDRWLGARLLAAGKARASQLLGPRHTGEKVAALLLFGLLCWLIFGRVNHEVDAPFVLSTEHAAYVTAPFSSFLGDVKVAPGAEVKKGDVLAALDTRELIAEEGGILADRDAHLREAEKAKAAEKFADVAIATARADQARARLEVLRLRRAQATIVAPFDGVVIEGDLKKRIGAPMRQGDVMFRIARTDEFYVECQIPESDVRELRVGGEGEIAFASQPRLKFPVRIRQVDPLAGAGAGGNVVIARCTVAVPPPDWWRPGMSGVAHLSVGPRSPGWVLTRRTVDFLRMQFWW